MSGPSEALLPHENKARMILWLLILPLLLVPTAGNTSAPARRSGASAQTPRLVEGYGKLPLAFEANQGQTDGQVKFFSRGAGYSLFLTATEAVLTLMDSRQSAGNADSSLGVRAEERLRTARNGKTQGRVGSAKAGIVQSESAVLRMELLGANAKAEVTGQNQLAGKSNYFLGNDPNKWHTNVTQYAKVRYGNIYPGIDLVYYGNQRELEYDFVVQPGADPNVIRLGIEGTKDLRLEHGELVLTSGAGDVHLRSPRIYQESGLRQEIRGGYLLRGKNEVRFRIAAYDRTKALIIDPVLAYSTYLGGSAWDEADGIAVDVAGNAYVSGFTQSADFPTRNAIQSTNLGAPDVFITKFNADGSGLVYSTYIGGSGTEGGTSDLVGGRGGIAVDATGNAYITGTTGSTDFPTVNPIQPTNHGGIYGWDTFVTKINANGNALVYSTYLGGSSDDFGNGIAVDRSGNAYVTGETPSTDFPTKNAIQSASGGYVDVFVTKINAAGSALVYSTYLGGSNSEYGRGIAVDPAGNAYITGSTFSYNFPTANPIFAFRGESAFVTKVSTGGSLVYSTFLAGSDGYNSAASAIAADAAGNAYVTGQTTSTSFPTLNAFQPYYHGSGDAFVTKFNPTGSAVVYSTYLGGSRGDGGSGIAVDSAGNAYVTGFTVSYDFPLVNAIQTRKPGYGSFVTELNLGGSVVVYSTYWGGSGFGNRIAVDSVGSAYVGGMIGSSKFPVSLLGFQRSPAGIADAFIAKIAQQTFVHVSSTKLGFPVTQIGHNSVTKNITVTNGGGGTLIINRIYIGGLDPDDFAETNTCGSALPSSASCSISLTFTPTDKNLRTATLGISDSDPASPQGIALSATGTVVLLSRKNLPFALQPVGTTSAPQNVTVTNLGTTQLDFTGFSITGTNATDFTHTTTCGTSIAVGANCTISVTFNPTALGKRTAAVSINDDGGGSPQKIALSGTGI